MKLYIIRHGQTDWNLAGKIQGSSDIPLNETGIAQAEALAEYMSDKSVKKVYSSKLKRAVKTAAILGEKINADVYLAEGFHEICFGKWEGLNWDEIAKQYPKEFASWNANPLENHAPGGETLLEVMTRSARTMDAILSETNTDKESPPHLRSAESVAVVSHGMTIHCMLSYLFREHPEDAEVCVPVSNASITVLEYNRFTKDIQLIEANISAHLEQ